VIAQRQLAEPHRRSAGASRPRLRPVPAPARPQRRLGQFLVAAALVIGALVFGVVALQAMVAETSFRMQDLTQRGIELRQEQGQLRLQIAELTSPRRITRRARGLGLYLPEEVKTLRVPSAGGGRAGKPAVASAKGGGSP
jgi:cell division protein FtsL